MIGGERGRRGGEIAEINWRWEGEMARGEGGRRKIKIIESNAKCRYLKKFTCKGTTWQVFICLRPLPC